MNGIVFPEYERFSSRQRAACGVEHDDLVAVPDCDHIWLQSDTFRAFQHLQKSARAAGLQLFIVSGHRSFERQLSIWNRKARGELTLLDPQGRPVERAALSDAQCVEMILNWSALPGASRHHWGTDFDVVDATVMPPGYEAQLTPEESDSLFAPLHAWLDAAIARDEAWGFTRVFEPGRGKVRPERWHLTHRPSARTYEKAFDPAMLPLLYQACGLELMDSVLPRLPEILADYVQCYFQPNSGR